MDLQILYNNPTRIKSKITKENPSMRKYKKAKRNPTQQVYKKMLATEQGRKDLEAAEKAGVKIPKSYKRDVVYKIGKHLMYTPKEIEKIKNNYQDQRKRYQDAVKSGQPHADGLLEQIIKSQNALADVLQAQSKKLQKESAMMTNKGYVPENMFDAEGNQVLTVGKAIKQNRADIKKIAKMKKKQADDYKAFLKQVEKMKKQEKNLQDPSKAFRKKKKKVTKKVSKKARRKARRKVAKKVAKKVTKKVAKKPSYKKTTKKVARKVAKKATKKVAKKVSKKKVRKKVSKRTSKKAGRKYNVRKNPIEDIEVMENVISKKKSKKKSSRKKAKKASKKKASIASQLHKLGGSKKKKTGKKNSFKKKSYKLKGNPPNKEQLMTKFQELTQHTVSEATGLLSGGALIKIYDHHIKQKFISPALSPFLSKLGAGAPFVDSLIDVLAAALVGKGLSMIGEKTKMDGFDVVGKGLIGAAVVQLGIKSIASLSTAAGMPMSGIISVPSMNGIIAVPYGMNGIIGVPQMGAFSADFQGMGAAGMTNADFGAYTTVGMDGGLGQSYMQDVDYGSGSVIPTAPRNPESLGGYENVEYSDEGEEGDF